LLCFQRFDEELRGQAIFVNEVMHVGNEIMASCHANAKRTVSNHLASISARWQQVSGLLSNLTTLSKIKLISVVGLS